MSIEAALAELTAAVKENTAMLKGIGKAASGGTAATGTKPTTTKPKGPTKETVAEKFGEFLNVTDKTERKNRIALMGKLNSYFEVAKVTDADPSKWPEALELLAKMEAGEDPFDDDAGAGESLV